MHKNGKHHSFSHISPQAEEILRVKRKKVVTKRYNRFIAADMRDDTLHSDKMLRKYENYILRDKDL